MEFPLALTKDQVFELRFEIVPASLKSHLTRRLRRGLYADERRYPLIWQNEVINRARTIADLPPYVLEPDIQGYYEPVEYAWHQGEFEACICLDAVQFVEFLAETVEDEWLPLSEANELVAAGNMSVRFHQSFGRSEVSVEVMAVTDLETRAEQVSHPNVRALIARMDSSLGDGDFPAVLHASASIFEVLAKEVVGTPRVQDQTLGSFFDRYRNDSSLPEPVLDYIHEIYRRRSTEPLAGHGQLGTPTITEREAKMIALMTKAFVTYEKQSSTMS